MNILALIIMYIILGLVCIIIGPIMLWSIWNLFSDLLKLLKIMPKRKTNECPRCGCININKDSEKVHDCFYCGRIWHKD